MSERMVMYLVVVGIGAMLIYIVWSYVPFASPPSLLFLAGALVGGIGLCIGTEGAER